MIDAKEKLLIEKIRLLCTQLEEEIDTKSSKQATEVISSKEKTLRMLIEMSCDYCWTFDPNTSQMMFHHIRGKQPEQLPIHRSYSTLVQGIDAEDQKLVYDAFYKILNFQNEREEVTFRRESASKIYEYLIVCCPLIEDGVLKVLGITRILAIEKKASIQEEEKFNALMSLSNMYIWEYDVMLGSFYANPSLFQKLKLEDRMYTYEELDEILDIPLLYKLREQVKKDQITEHTIISIGIKDHDLNYIFESNFRAIKNKNGRCQMILGTLLDITEREILKTNASKDPLTSCFNRRIADMTLQTSFEKFREGEEFYTLIFIDVDNFKHINDTYGHDMGDYVLKHICEQINKEIRSNDVLCRWGGDEFLLICSGISKENIYAYIDRMRKLIERTDFVFNGDHVQTTISMGAAYYYRTDTSFEQAMKRADRSVYKSKLAGRNKVCILK